MLFMLLNLVSWDIVSVLVTGGFAIVGTYAFIAAIEGSYQRAMFGAVVSTSISRPLIAKPIKIKCHFFAIYLYVTPV